jgi:hypothetical protein
MKGLEEVSILPKIFCNMHIARRNMHIAIESILPLTHICAHLNFELRDCLITFPIFVLSQRLIATNVCKLFSFNRDVSHLHLNEARRIDDVSRGSLSCYEILTNN